MHADEPHLADAFIVDVSHKVAGSDGKGFPVLSDRMKNPSPRT